MPLPYSAGGGSMPESDLSCQEEGLTWRMLKLSLFHGPAYLHI